MFDVGFAELVLISVIGLLVLGPQRLPKVAAELGKWVGRARRTATQLRRQLEREIELSELETPPSKPSQAPPAKPAEPPPANTIRPPAATQSAAAKPGEPAPPASTPDSIATPAPQTAPSESSEELESPSAATGAAPTRERTGTSDHS